MAEENSSIEKLAEMIKDHQHIVFFGGAGVSTESAIPDFRGKNGLYYQKGKREMVSGRNAFPPFLQGASGFVFHYVQENGGNNQPCGA